MSGCFGNPAIRQRKGMELRKLLALQQVSRRVTLMNVDLGDPVRIRLLLRAPVPCLNDPSEPLRVESAALLALHYPEQAFRQAMRGFSFVSILAPARVWLPQVALQFGPVQPLCLGPWLPAGIPWTELLLLTYGALTLQTVQLDIFDPAGVMNAEAAAWWLEHRLLLPLTRDPFIVPEQDSST